jgi:hypothetical protein
LGLHTNTPTPTSMKYSDTYEVQLWYTTTPTRSSYKDEVPVQIRLQMQCFGSESVSWRSRSSPKSQCGPGSRVSVESGSIRSHADPDLGHSVTIQCFGDVKNEYIDIFKIWHSSGGVYMFLSSKTREYTEIVKIFKTLDPDSGAKFLYDSMEIRLWNTAQLIRSTTPAPKLATCR